MSKNDKWNQFSESHGNENTQQDTDAMNDLDLNSTNSKTFQQTDNTKHNDSFDIRQNDKEQSRPTLTPGQQSSPRPNLDVTKILKAKPRLSY